MLKELPGSRVIGFTRFAKTQSMFEWLSQWPKTTALVLGGRKLSILVLWDHRPVDEQ